MDQRSLTPAMAGRILRAFGWIAPYCVSFGDFLELICCVGCGIPIRMILHRQRAVSLLNLLRCSASIDTKHFIIVGFLLRLGHANNSLLDLPFCRSSNSNAA